MRYSLFLFVTILIGLLIFGACSKDDETSKPNATIPKSLYPTGTASFDANGYAFVATHARARYRSNGNGLGIELKNNEGRTLRIGIPDFQGVGTYNVSEPWEAYYSYVITSKFVTWYNGENSVIEITEFDQIEGTLSGKFSMTLEYYINSLSIEEGIFEDIPIVELLEPKPGNVDFFLDDIYYRSEHPYAIITNNFQLMVFAPYHPNEYTFALKKYIGLDNYVELSGLNFVRNYQLGSSFSDWALPVLDLNIDYENKKLSFNTNSFSTTIDFEIRIKDIPIISFPMEVESGMTKLDIGSTEYKFTESSYYRPDNGVDNYYFEATNTAGNKLVIEFNYWYTNHLNLNLHSPTAGYGVFLEFFITNCKLK